MIIPTIEELKQRNKGSRLRIRKLYPEFYEFLENTYKDTTNFSEKLYRYYNNITEPKKCYCGNNCTYINFVRGYTNFCSCACSNRSVKNKQSKRQTCLERYGGIGYASKTLLNKTKKTKLERYGNENYRNSEKIKQTCLERYGGESPMHTKIFYEKSKQTCKNKYGVEHISQVSEIKQKIRRTNLERYGDEFYFRVKSRQTCLERYGVERPFQSKMVQDKVKQILDERYGGHALLNSSILERCRKSKRITFIKNHPDIIDIKDTDTGYVYICRCPHPECTKCNKKQFEITNIKYLNRNISKTEMCTILNPGEIYKGTSVEIFIRIILDKLGIEYKTNIRNIIFPKELDIYIPSRNIAIECNGIYWHSLKDKNYHYEKFKECQEKDIQLLNFWEDQIIRCPDTIKNIIQNILVDNSSLKNYQIQEINNITCKKFIFENNLNHKIGKIHYGLFIDDKLISIISITNNKNTVTINNFCGIQNTFKILFDYICHTLYPKIINYTIVNDYEVNKFLSELGFKYINTKLQTFYIDKNYKRYVKDTSNKMLKIVDSGKNKYKWTRPK